MRTVKRELTPEPIKEFLRRKLRVTSGPGKESRAGTGSSAMRLSVGRTPTGVAVRPFENTSNVSRSALKNWRMSRLP